MGKPVIKDLSGKSNKEIIEILKKDGMDEQVVKDVLEEIKKYTKKGEIKDITKEERVKMIEKSFTQVIKDMGLDLTDPNIIETPKRIANMYVNQIFKGLYEEAPNLKAFPNDEKYDGMVIVDDIRLESTCIHHYMPFFGKCDIAYIPGDTIIGLSKLPRLVDYYARTPNLQEKLTQQIYDHLKKVLGHSNIIVRINAFHTCVSLRGVKDPCSNTTTCKAGGVFGVTGNGAARKEFFDHLLLDKNK